MIVLMLVLVAILAYWVYNRFFNKTIVIKSRRRWWD